MALLFVNSRPKFLSLIRQKKQGACGQMQRPKQKIFFFLVTFAFILAVIQKFANAFTKNNQTFDERAKLFHIVEFSFKFVLEYKFYRQKMYHYFTG